MGRATVYKYIILKGRLGEVIMKEIWTQDRYFEGNREPGWS